MVVLQRLVLLSVIALAVGCGRRAVYDWGSYNRSIAAMYNSPENYVLDEDLQRLAEEVEETPPGRVPPGKFAHVGFLYSLKGQNAQARKYFELEKRTFPESQVFMDRLIANAGHR